MCVSSSIPRQQQGKATMNFHQKRNYITAGSEQPWPGRFGVSGSWFPHRGLSQAVGPQNSSLKGRFPRGDPQHRWDEVPRGSPWLGEPLVAFLHPASAPNPTASLGRGWAPASAPFEARQGRGSPTPLPPDPCLPPPAGFNPNFLRTSPATEIK